MKSGLGIDGAPRKGVPKTKEERKTEHLKRYGTKKLLARGTGLHLKPEYDGRPIVLINVETGKPIPGGLIVNETKALATSCHGYDLGEGKKMLWSEGVIGTLSLPEQKKYCKMGMKLQPAPPRLAARIKGLREAGIRFE